GYKLIEASYYQGVSSTVLNKVLKPLGTSQIRLVNLRYLLQAKPLVPFLDINNALNGFIIDHTFLELEIDSISR
ncbi:phosphoenolpyruvate phosphomutase, partial [Gammaproteobacteria bacterium]|nr:phosphoenolpyruvate phosphomutase [Gammaproteobacteria bacterium]